MSKPNLPPGFTYVRTDEDGTVHAVQVMPVEGAVCDFCMTPDVHWTFPCRTFTQRRQLRAYGVRANGEMAQQDIDLTSESLSAWAACDACAALIMRGDRDALTRRSAHANLRRTELPITLSSMITLIRPLHDTFWSNREGAPIHHEHRPTEDPTA